jgi:hypothetical protein
VRRKAAEAVPPLRNGDHLDQRTFHERYLAMPESVGAELIGGRVVLRGRHTARHAEFRGLMICGLGRYELDIGGVHALSGPTILLNGLNEPEPDGVLRINEACGGSSRVGPGGFVQGPPELFAEVAYGGESIELHEKREEYAAAGVCEYVVILLREQALRCFRFEDGTYVDFPADADGVWRSRVFPGLWLNIDALLRLDGPALLKTLEQGLKTPEHAAFVQKLQAARGAPAPANPG